MWLPVPASPCWGCFWCLGGCGWCVLWLVPRHPWRWLICAIPRHSWLGFAAGGGGCCSSLLAEDRGCGYPPLLAGVRRLWWCAVPCHSWLGSLPVAAGCFVGGGVSCCMCLWCVWVRVVAVLWCVVCVCGVRVVGGVVWWCGVGVSSAFAGVPGCVCVVSCLSVVGCPRLSWFGLRLVFVWVLLACAVGPPPLLAEGPGCIAPRLLAGVCHCAAVVGLLPLLAEGIGCGAPQTLAGVRRWVCWLVPRHSWPRAACVVPRHSWLGSAGCGGGGPLAAMGPGVPLSLALVGVCALCGASCWCGWCVGVVRGVVAVCVCVCVRCVVCGVCHTLVGSRRRSTWSRPESGERAEKRGPVDV